MNRVPHHPGGGTVEYVTPDRHYYTKSIEQREEGGTPDMSVVLLTGSPTSCILFSIGAIRAGLVFKLTKQIVGQPIIEEAEKRLLSAAVAAWSGHPLLVLLGPDPSVVPRLSVISLLGLQHLRVFGLETHALFLYDFPPHSSLPTPLHSLLSFFPPLSLPPFPPLLPTHVCTVRFMPSLPDRQRQLLTTQGDIVQRARAVLAHSTAFAEVTGSASAAPLSQPPINRPVNSGSLPSGFSESVATSWRSFGLPLGATFDSLFSEHGSYLHYNFVSQLLHDLFGIQTRSGCNCAGPLGLYFVKFVPTFTDDFHAGHRILGIPPSSYKSLERIIIEDHFDIHPGWTRFSLHFTLRPSELLFTVRALDWVARYGWCLLPLYRFRPRDAKWRYAGFHVLGQRSFEGLAITQTAIPTAFSEEFANDAACRQNVLEALRPRNLTDDDDDERTKRTDPTLQTLFNDQALFSSVGLRVRSFFLVQGLPSL